MLLTTQYLEEADRLADRIAVVNNGAVIAEGTPAELKARLGTTVLEFTLCDQVGASQAEELLRRTWATSPVRDGNMVELTMNDGARQVMEALRVLDQAGVRLERMSLREPSLDDVFLTLTGHRTSPSEMREAQ